MVFLGLDTATSRGSVSLARPGAVLVTASLSERSGHAKDLLPAIEGLLREAALRPADLAGIGVALGPGSFTGLRVGMGTAKGLGYALNLGVTGLSTLEALARAAAGAVPGLNGVLCTVLDAGRGEVYAALFRVEGSRVARLSDDRACRPDRLVEGLPEGSLLVGDAAAAVRCAAAAGRPPGVIEPWPPLAPILALHAAETVARGSTYRPGVLRPNYIRPSDAEAARRRS